MNGWKGRLLGEARNSSVCDILYLFAQGNIIFIRENSGILKSYVCGNHVCG